MTEMHSIYQNGHIELEKRILTSQPVEVIVTFLENVESEEKKPLSFSEFSFTKSRKLLQDYKGSFSEEVIKERRENV